MSEQDHELEDSSLLVVACSDCVAPSEEDLAVDIRSFLAKSSPGCWQRLVTHESDHRAQVAESPRVHQQQTARRR